MFVRRVCGCVCVGLLCVFFFQAEDGIRDAQESRGLGDVYKRQRLERGSCCGADIERLVAGIEAARAERKHAVEVDFLSLIHI